MDERMLTVIASAMNGYTQSIAILVNCLKNSGALEDGRYETALEQTINAEGAEIDRPDYQAMRQILAILQGKPPPALRLIQGGKPEEPA